ncbi:MAG: hypothetical protein ACYC5O_07905 [Anaerolineae bacterium]
MPDDPKGVDGAQDGEAPEVYGISKGAAGWSFNRRGFLAAGAAAVAAVAAAGSVAEQAVVEAQPVRVALDRSTGGAAAPDASHPGWRLTNNSGREWGEGTRLSVESGDGGLRLSLPVPRAAVGETVVVRPDVPLIAGPGATAVRGQLLVAEDVTYDIFLPLVRNDPTPTPPGDSGAVPPGETGGTISGPNGETRWLPCGTPIPAGWVCVCNCVTACSCDGYCTCNQVCTCDSVCSCVGAGHYWYPN